MKNTKNKLLMGHIVPKLIDTICSTIDTDTVTYVPGEVKGGIKVSNNAVKVFIYMKDNGSQLSDKFMDVTIEHIENHDQLNEDFKVDVWTLSDFGSFPAGGYNLALVDANSDDVAKMLLDLKNGDLSRFKNYL